MIKLMKCGHSTNATNSKGNPVCAICIGTTPDAEIVDTLPNLEGREACCSFIDFGKCGNQGGEIKEGRHGWVKSSLKLAFFEYCPSRPHDLYYCGCWGWE